jgi:hypothetical protein
MYINGRTKKLKPLNISKILKTKSDDKADEKKTVQIEPIEPSNNLKSEEKKTTENKEDDNQEEEENEEENPIEENE